MSHGITHIIGAGLAGLSAATRLVEAGQRVVVYEASAQAGGRCRSYHDAAFGGVIDNGNHLLLSGNDATHNYLRRIGSADAFAKARDPVFDFADAKTAKRWQLRLSKGILPFWLLDKHARVPNTRAGEYFSILRLLKAKPHQSVLALLDGNALLYKRLWHPLLLSALNTHPSQASAVLAGAILRGTLLKGGRACIPLVADGLSAIFIDPALRLLEAGGNKVLFNQRVKNILWEGDRAARLGFASGGSVTLGESDNLIYAAPCWGVDTLLPGVSFPDATRAILNAHFRIAPPAAFPRILGVVNATTEWIFAFPDRISITVSDADRLMGEDRGALAARIWREVSAITGLASDLPAWQIVKEKRATFAATPEQDAKRPGTATRWRNVTLAGDWVQTGLPATIEGAVLSGERAAEHILRKT